MDISQIKNKRDYARGRAYAEEAIEEFGFEQAAKTLEKRVQCEKDFNTYNDFDRGVESVIRERRH